MKTERTKRATRAKRTIQQKRHALSERSSLSTRSEHAKRAYEGLKPTPATINRELSQGETTHQVSQHSYHYLKPENSSSIPFLSFISILSSISLIVKPLNGHEWLIP